ncbi:glycosyl transferase [Methylobacterium indicum]|uniref:glycosyltransferase family 2 protein n=1 Tax=Methylobacterium indicum TaxID=1775910 RepID=UPI00073428D6|nr:glycosyltransferase family 2 protein [Methylobacterium indicum]KTS22781.1 glycosyl transferase [Methylobacterium indicum]KTS42149.1 glycosyl transferase [Methylobacterium indicum]KTS52574.1 glycosyl transferase [Methylobacterium indicum]
MASDSCRIVPHPDPDFTRALIPGRPTAGRWLALDIALDRFADPVRPLLRFVRAEGGHEDALLPGPVLGRATWLGPVPPSTTAILLAAPAEGFRVEARLLSRPAMLALCARRRPDKLPVALYQWLRRDARRLRNTLRIAAGVMPLSRYPAWKAARTRPVEPGFDQPPAGPLPRLGLILEALPEEAGAVRRTLAALMAQDHADWRLALCWRGPVPAGIPADPRISGEGLPAGVALGHLRPGDELAPDALTHLAAAFTGETPADLAYADSETETPDGLRPALKPGWSPDLALTTLYPGRPLLVTADLAARSRWAPEQGARALLLAAALAEPKRVRRIPRILCRTVPDAPDPDGHAADLTEALRRAGGPAVLARRGDVLDLDWPLPDPAPLVSVIVPTRDRPDLLRVAVRGVLHDTAYPAIELVIVDNGSTDPAVAALYAEWAADSRVRRLDRPGPFNFSRLVNDGAAAGRGAILVLLNNDVEVLHPDWLSAMVRQALRPEVGAVGAKLLFGNGRIQHAGVVVGLGGRAGHILRNRPADTPGHLRRLTVAHEVAGVTAACLAVTREKFEAVGGLDAEAFPIDFNDIDLCLRLGARGWRSVWTPRATLAHHESVSRGPSVGPARARFEAEGDRFAARWRAVIRDDPYYHPAFSVTTFGEELE